MNRFDTLYNQLAGLSLIVRPLLLLITAGVTSPDRLFA